MQRRALVLSFCLALLCASVTLWLAASMSRRSSDDQLGQRVRQMAQQQARLREQVLAQADEIRHLKLLLATKVEDDNGQLQVSSPDGDGDAVEDDASLVAFNLSAHYVPPSEWLRKLETRADPTIQFSLPLPPGDIRRYIGRHGTILPRGQEFSRVRAQENRTATAAQCDELRRFLTVPTYTCRTPKRFGNAGDGGWTVCLDRPFPTPTSSCVSYSFGLAFDWSYDRDISHVCRDYAFDPTLRVKGSQDMRHDERRVEGLSIDYFSMGLSGHGNPIINSRKRIPTMTLQAVMKLLGHDHIDILKVDVEGSEWGMMHSMAEWMDSPLDRTDQILLEMHFMHLGFFYLWDALMVLHGKGFRLFHVHQNLQCKPILLGNSECSIRHCMEFGFIRPPAVST
eukprot:GGOE01049268.1.p1 GENE.GGOE01049268.1~~GGOE01049268.1.p1  ORF type:complete len:397 (-),score=101.19 GGOE01049268.1:25-1215(-)